MSIRLYNHGTGHTEFDGYGFCTANNLDEADAVALYMPSTDELDDIFNRKGDYVEVIVYTSDKEEDIRAATNYDIKLLITSNMSKEEQRFRVKRFISEYYERLQLWTTKSFYEKAMNIMPSMLWLKRKDGVHKYVNDFFCKVVNKERDDVEGRRHAYIWNVEDDDISCIKSEEQAMKQGTMVESVEDVTLNNGETMRLSTFKAPVYDRRGKVYGTVGVGIDTTMENVLSEAIRKRNSSYETLFLTLGCGILNCDLEGNVISANNAAVRILGFNSLEELMQDSFKYISSVVVEDDRENMVNSIKSLKKEGDSCSLEYRVRHKDGRMLYVMGDVKLMYIDGQYQYQRYMLDFTEWKESERRQKDFNKNVMAALGSDYTIIIYVSLATGKGELIAIAPEYDLGDKSHIRGTLEFKKLANKFIELYVDDEYKKELSEQFDTERLCDTFDKSNCMIKNFRTNKGVYLRVKAVRFDTDEGKCMVLGLSDVDDEVRAEIRKRMELESALVAANSANEIKSSFLSNMTHDIRTPMNAIVNYIRLASKNIDNKERVAGYIDKMTMSCNHLLELVNNTLDMSKLESGKMEINRNECWIPELINKVTSVIGGMARDRNISLETNVKKLEHEHVCCDDLRMHQILINVLSNAVKYSKENGWVKFEVQEIRSDENTCDYMFVVEDKGIGMGDEFLSKLFTSFERENNTTVSGIQGTGLGMAITKNLLNLMNGAINVESEKGVGTKVTITVPFEIDKKYSVVTQIEELKGKRALVISREYQVCAKLERILGSYEMHVEWTLSEDEDKFRILHAQEYNDFYDLYVVDYWEGSYEKSIGLLRYIKDRCVHESCMIVIGDNEDISRADLRHRTDEFKIDGICTKPIDIVDFSTTLQKAVRDEKELGVSESNAKKHVLLVEDNEINREIALELMSDFSNIKVDEAENGEIAVEKVRNSSPGYYSLVLMDVQMPVLNGYGATLKIRQLDDEMNSKVPIFAMTANAFEEDKQKALACGMNGHISKPIEIEELYGVLKDMLLGKMDGGIDN